MLSLIVTDQKLLFVCFLSFRSPSDSTGNQIAAESNSFTLTKVLFLKKSAAYLKMLQTLGVNRDCLAHKNTVLPADEKAES